MAMYRVTVKRLFAEYAEIDVESDDINEAKDVALDSLETADWSEQELDDELIDDVTEIDS